MTENTSAADTEVAVEIDPIDAIHRGDCPSLSGRSTLGFAIGRHKDQGTLHLAIIDNSGGGMWCKDWASASDIQDIVLGEQGLTAKSFHRLHEGRSINTGGFILSALKELGLVQVNGENSRLHEHAPGTTFEKVATAYMAPSSDTKPDATGRKSQRIKAKEG